MRRSSSANCTSKAITSLPERCHAIWHCYDAKQAYHGSLQRRPHRRRMIPTIPFRQP
jgi:hypothetical protein